MAKPNHAINKWTNELKCSQKKKHLVNTYLKMYSTTLAIREMKIKTTL